MTILPLIAAAIFGVLGLMHLVYTLRDIGGRPRYFRPTDLSLLAACSLRGRPSLPMALITGGASSAFT